MKNANRRVAKWEKNFGLLILSIKKSFQKKLTTLCPKIETPLKIKKSFQSISRITLYYVKQNLHNQKTKNKLGEGINYYKGSQSLLYNKQMQRLQRRRVSPLSRSMFFVISPFGAVPFLFDYPSRRPSHSPQLGRRSSRPTRFGN